MLLESENHLPHFLVTSLHDHHGKQDRKWYGYDHREGRLGGQVLCVCEQGKRGWIISCTPTSSCLLVWVQYCLFRLKLQFDSRWCCRCEHAPIFTWDLHLQYSPRASEHWPLIFFENVLLQWLPLAYYSMTGLLQRKENTYSKSGIPSREQVRCWCSVTLGLNPCCVSAELAVLQAITLH